VSWFNDFIRRFFQETKPRPQKLANIIDRLTPALGSLLLMTSVLFVRLISMILLPVGLSHLKRRPELRVLIDRLCHCECSWYERLRLNLILVEVSRLSRYGSRSFSVSGPTAWNLLPTAVRDLSSSSGLFARS